jgi:hypothetical protein
MATLKAPAVACIWKVANLERNTQDGKVVTVHYTVAATDDTYAASAYGSLGLDGDTEKVAEVEEALQSQLDEQRAPTKAAGPLVNHGSTRKGWCGTHHSPAGATEANQSRSRQTLTA